jgi:glucoamylase
VTDSFRTVYGINSGIAQGRAVAVGRYSEDVYYNGNPWYLATLAAAEQMYSAVYQWNKIGSITIDSVSLPFFKDILPSIATGTYAGDSATFTSIVSAVKTYGDDFIAVVQKYTPANGGLAEQFDKSTGAPLSAVDLTWSYAAFLTASERRAGVTGPTWGEASNNVPPTTCTAPTACNSKVTFNVRATTTYGESVYVVGQLTQLGNWDPASAQPLSASQYTSSDPLWSAAIDLPASTVFDYKYIRKDASGVVTWESDPNRSFTTSSGCGSTATVSDTWR